MGENSTERAAVFKFMNLQRRRTIGGNLVLAIGFSLDDYSSTLIYYDTWFIQFLFDFGEYALQHKKIDVNSI